MPSFFFYQKEADVKVSHSVTVRWSPSPAREGLGQGPWPRLSPQAAGGRIERRGASLHLATQGQGESSGAFEKPGLAPETDSFQVMNLSDFHISKESQQ